MNNLKPCKYLCVDLCDDKAHIKGVQLEFENVEVMDDGQRLMIKDNDIVVAYNMDYVLCYTATLNMEDEQ